jgi:hypothetical protein
MDPAALRQSATVAVVIVAMAATFCGIVHAIAYYAVFGVNYFEFGSRDDFILTALRSPASLLLVLLFWAFAYPRAISPDFHRIKAVLLYFIAPALIIGGLGYAQGYMVREGYGKLIGQPACKLTIAYADNRTEDVYGATPLGSSGQFVLFWLYQPKEVRIISNQAAKSVICNVAV